MPLKKIVFKPGINRENTRYTTEGGFYEGDKVRFRQGTPEKIGGWKYISQNFYLGVCRFLWNWITLGGSNYLAVGTHLKFYVESGGVYYDITPLRYSTDNEVVNNPFTTTLGDNVVLVTDVGSDVQDGDLVNISNVVAPVDGIPAAEFNTQHVVTRVDADSYTIEVTTNATAGAIGVGGVVTFDYFYYTVALSNAYATTNGSNKVVVTDNGHGCITGDFVTLFPTTTFNGVTVFGEYQVTVLSSNTYSITVSTNANATGSNVGTTYAQYQINIGPEIQEPLVGWGAGGWGLGTWGNGLSSNIPLRLWSGMNFGEDLVFSPRGGPLYYWKASDGLGTRARDVRTYYDATDAPETLLYTFISDASRFTFAFGTNDYGDNTLDPMLVRWSDQESTINWTPSVTNQAGSLRLSHGSEILSAVQVRQEIVVFTDSSVYSLQYLGPPVVWGSTLLGDNISIEGPNVAVLASGVLYWMGKDKFYKYDGAVQTLSCDLRQYVFGDINQDQGYQFFAGTSEGFNEVWWFYCSADSMMVDRYVVYNYLENLWFYGQLERTAWLDSGLRSYPMAATYDKNVVFHELGTDDNTLVVPQAIDSYIQTSEFDIDDGHNFGFIYRMLPDITFRGSDTTSPQVTMTLIPLQNSGSGPNIPESTGGVDYATVTRTAVVPIEEFTGQVFIRVRGRQLAFRIQGNQLGLQWQLGAPRIDIRSDGRRGNT